jgi:CheY-like chemotaxis protein
MLIVLIEDDPVQAELMENSIKSKLGAETWRIPTESDFDVKFEDIATKAPVAIVIDIMLRWTDPAEEMPPTPVDYDKTDGYRRAGLRCRKRLSEDQRTQSIPVIIYTVLRREPLGEGIPECQYLQKGDGLEHLLERLQQIVLRQ